MANKIFKWKLAALTFLTAFSFTACNSWLDVKPKTEQEAEDLFSTQDGFKEALAGVYTGMNQAGLYGREMSFGLVEAAAQRWTVSTYSPYSDVVTKYDYESTSVRPIVDTIWMKGYNVIANANSILEYIDEKAGVFTGNNQQIIKGEALAIRAYMHFDLLRLFAPYGKSSSAEDGIPYVHELTKQVTQSVSPVQVMEYVIADLKQAVELLKVDPIVTGEEITKEEDNGYLLNRQFHLNYYAVLGLLARVEMYVGNTGDARNYAMEVIAAHENRGKFPWVKESDVTDYVDGTFSTELLFALHTKKLVDYLKGYLTAADSPLEMQIGVQDLFPANEFRKYFFGTVGGKNNISIKLQQDEKTSGGKDIVRERMPMIRLSEMYYIVAECDKGNAADALESLNKVLSARGYLQSNLLDPAVINTSDLVETEILKEYRREFICEGQLFFYHKRKGTLTLNDLPVNYRLPKPELEEEFGK